MGTRHVYGMVFGAGLLSVAIQAAAQTQARQACVADAFLAIRHAGKTRNVTAEQLAALPQYSIKTSTPWASMGAYTGPYLRDVVALGGLPRVTKLTVYTWDNYTVEIPATDMTRYNIVLASSYNGQALGLDDWGPLFVMYPYDHYTELRRPAGVGKMAWQVCRIDIS